MDGYLRQSTASQTRTVGAFIDSTDFITPKNALTINASDVRLKKNGGASAVKNAGGGTADGQDGMYALTWDATDTNTVGQLFYSIEIASALLVWGSYVVLEEAVYDALYAAAAPGYVANAPVNLAQITASTALATRFAAAVGVESFGTVGSGSSVTSIVTSSLDPTLTVTDQLVGRVLIFDVATSTANLQGVARVIAASTVGGIISVATLPAAPSGGDTFAIL